jgi:dihydroorotate dehydrogenase electron transfer subunit
MRLEAYVDEQYNLGVPAGKIMVIGLHAPEIARQSRPGQFIMVKVPGPLLARPFAVAAVRGSLIFLVYEIKGPATAAMSRLLPQEQLLVWGPLGRGFSQIYKSPLLLGGGAGLAPVLFAWQQYPRGAMIIGFDYWRPFNQMGVLLKNLGLAWDMRQDINVIGPNSLLAPGQIYITCQHPEADWNAPASLVTGPLNPHNLRHFNAIYASGPWPMLKKVSQLAHERQMPCQIAAEAMMACGVGACRGCAVPDAKGGYLHICQQGPVLDSRELDWERL